MPNILRLSRKRLKSARNKNRVQVIIALCHLIRRQCISSGTFQENSCESETNVRVCRGLIVSVCSKKVPVYSGKYLHMSVTVKIFKVNRFYYI